jgi:hypothetical protein
MKNSLYLLTGLLPFLAACTGGHVIEVKNPTALNREEIVELDLSVLRSVRGDEPFRLLDSYGFELPYQVTYDKKVVFPVAVEAHGTTEIRVASGLPMQADTVACGAFYPERKDDLAWENDRAAYRAYGPALQASGERAYGYDIWTKSVTQPVVRKRYIASLAGGINFHEDHGNGMDAYTVGPTLGGGTAALVDSTGNIVYPRCFSAYEILDNGPLRFSVRLDYESGETRLITLDAGEYLNKTSVTFANPAHPAIAPGIVIHRQNPDGYELSPDNGYMAYADLTDNVDNGNGVIFIGVVTPKVDSMLHVPLEGPQGDAIGHILAKKSLEPTDTYVYYWGSGWSKGTMPDWQSWKKYLADFSVRVRNPLVVKMR